MFMYICNFIVLTSILGVLKLLFNVRKRHVALRRAALRCGGLRCDAMRRGAFMFTFCCAVLCYAVLRCATLCHAVLRCATLCYAVLGTLHFIVLSSR
jgi:hypothetical protein